MLGQRHKTLANFARARQAVPEATQREVARQARWIAELLA
jgi:tRNA (adenine22-N1)-methyltransferase